MKMKTRFLGSLLLSMAILGLVPTGASSSDQPMICFTDVTMVAESIECHRSRSAGESVRNNAEAEFSFHIELRCWRQMSDGSVCYSPDECDVETRPGERLFRHNVFWWPVSDPDDRHMWGWSCLTDEPPGPSPGEVIRAFKTITWEPASLVIQPPDGRTLVNFPTNFYTEVQPVQVQDVPIRHVEVTITAKVVEYVWRFGDGTTASTTRPGSPWTKASPEVDVFHEFTEAGSFSPSVDIVLRGSYRIAGDSGTYPIEETLTVPGPQVGLEAIEAHPVLVG